MRKGDNRNVVIRKEEVVEGEAHAGAWKVAYADFVTAMMAFFLLMWLLNATTEDQRKGLADYFSPNSVLSHASSGTGDPFGGHTAFDSGAMVSDRGAVQVIAGNRPISPEPVDADARPAPPERGDDDSGKGPATRPQETPDTPPRTETAATASATAATSANSAVRPGAQPRSTQATARPAGSAAPATSGAAPAASGTPSARPPDASLAAAARAPTEAELQDAAQRREAAAFAKAAQAIGDAVRGDPTLADLAKQLAIEVTPEGLRIQILDEENRSMFDLGSAVPNDRVRLLLQKVTPVLLKLPEDISLAGYTDATPFTGPDRTNWELSTERANAARRLLVDDGVPEARIRNVTGHADRDPLLPATPFAAANRRIAIVVLRDTPGPTGAPASAKAMP